MTHNPWTDSSVFRKIESSGILFRCITDQLKTVLSNSCMDILQIQALKMCSISTQRLATSKSNYCMEPVRRAVRCKAPENSTGPLHKQTACLPATDRDVLLEMHGVEPQSRSKSYLRRTFLRNAMCRPTPTYLKRTHSLRNKKEPMSIT